jgi:GT2 family glycosyltransferase/MoaA/NifB/PqqE/SkfB family radical SAM enzyme
MDFALYKRLIAELDSPGIIRLNYSGESGHYPQLIDAIRLAKSKGAYVELVSALSSMKRDRVEALVASGLDRLSVSVHTLEDEQYQAIYGFGSATGLRQRLAWLRAAQQAQGVQTPALDFAFVAMARNLSQLNPVMQLAEQFEVPQLDIHPVIRRDPIAETFPEELDSKSRLKQAFLSRLSQEVVQLATVFPRLKVNYSTPEPELEHTLGHTPSPYPPPLPKGARIASCEQNPWSTVHVLANGDVVTCEVRDTQPLGNLHQNSLREIWHGAMYRQFRRDFVCGSDPKCAQCVYKHAYLAPTLKQRLLSRRIGRGPFKTLAQQSKQAISIGAAWSLRTVLDAVQATGRLFKPWRTAGPALPLPSEEDGVSVIIPERDAPEMLAECLQALEASLSRLDVPKQVIIVCNGTPAESYAQLQEQFPAYQWCFAAQALGFSAAIAEGIALARWNWVFLLNNDMQIEANTLPRLWSRRAPHLFSLAAQILFQDNERRREETGLTGLNPAQGLQALYDRAPFTSAEPVTHLYSGGGASLFQRRLLARFLDSGAAYAPFYWEDVDWGMRAQRLGYENLFVPDALAHHRHRATVSRFYSATAIAAMQERNALVNGLAHGWYRPRLGELAMYLAKHRAALFRPQRLLYLLRQRLANGLSKHACYHYQHEVVRLKTGPVRAHLPYLLLVSPFALFPIHGSARRIHSLLRHLSQQFRIVVVADEGWQAMQTDDQALEHIEAVWLLRTPRREVGAKRLQRMGSHSRPELRATVREALQVFQPQVVQVEHEELAPLVTLKGSERWYLTLHDVNLGSDAAADRALRPLLQRFDGSIACSREDLALIDQHATLIENGVDLQAMHNAERSSGRELLFIGPFSYRPNRDGLAQFLLHCWPRILAAEPQTRLLVLGGDEGLHAAKQAPFNHPRVTFLPYTSDIRPALRQATLTTNPLRNIRGSCIKTIESLAAGRLCVSTEDAARGWTEHELPGLITAASDEAFAERVIEFLRDTARRHALEEQPSALMERFDWSHQAAQQARLYAS